ncbi:GNAT family N-acetyltransferase [Marinomonas spartinae]|uniref:GNAT family N-acetyltransferase n=1 Tax=Marinomonas spartinae TaxID=1792290 RepID=UPI002D8057A3|nr:GNAT family N-acetyltransferase [Marinomonas spartinae]
MVHGPFQACSLGYSIGQQHQGKGLMTEILQASIAYMFETVGLNRVMASYMPANKASGRVLEKLGFEREGYARKYLKIAGNWEDHVLTSFINPNGE